MLINEYKSLPSIKQEENESLDQLYQTIKQYQQMTSVIISNIDSKTVQELDNMVKIDDSIAVDAFNKLYASYKSIADSKQVALNSTIKSTMVLIIALLLVMLIISFLINTTISRTLIKRIADIQKNINNLSNHNFRLCIRSKSKDELSNIQNQLCDFTAGIDKSITSTFNQISESGNAIIPMITRISDIKFTANDEADISSQVSSASMEMSATIAEISESITNLVDNTQSTLEISQKGELIINRVTDYSNSLQSTMTKLSEDVTGLKDEAGKIGEVVNVINDLSDQTNLLALNAAIEAARAGEAGRGFAVVADEVRKLAERTQVATNEIERVISEIQASITETANEAKNAEQSVITQQELTKEANANFAEILNDVRNIDNLITGISAAVEQQSATTIQISSNMEKTNNELK